MEREEEEEFVEQSNERPLYVSDSRCGSAWRDGVFPTSVQLFPIDRMGPLLKARCQLPDSADIVMVGQLKRKVA